MSSAFEVSPNVNDAPIRPDLVEIHNCVRDTLASLNVEGVEFFIELDRETLTVTLQTKKFLEAQDLAVDLGKKIEQIAAADVLELAVYKRKNAEANAFLIKEMALKKSGMPADEDEIAISPTPIAQQRRSVNLSSNQKSEESEYRPKLRMYGMLNSYILRMFSGFFALGIGICVVYGFSRLMDSMEQKPLTNIDVNQLPGLGTINNDPEVMEYQVAFPRGTYGSKFVVFLPTQPVKPKLPCIFIAPSGKKPLYGQTLEEMHHWEYLNYAKAGYAVVAYDVDGPIENMNEANEAALLERPSQLTISRLKAYKSSDAGVLNAKLAIDYAIARIPQIDPDAIYTAGTGAGGTLSLMVAATDKRVKAAIAYSPQTNLPKQYSSLIDTISKSVPGYKEFIDRSSPHNSIDKMTKPMFIFHDDRETATSLEDTTNFVESIKKNNSLVSLTHATDAEIRSGDRMFSTSSKQAIEWLNERQK
jgi:dienelactone hydrolase